jgi:hypothetical protein
MSLRPIFILSFLSFTLLSCSSIKSNRTPAAADSCFIMIRKLLRSTPKNLSEDARKRVAKDSFLFWKKHYKTPLLSPAMWSKKFKLRWTRRFANLNDNEIPVKYIDDAEETLVSISKYSEYLKKIDSESEEVAIREAPEVIPPVREPEIIGEVGENLEQEVIENINKWSLKVKSYGDDINELLKEYSLLDYNIDILKQLKKKIKYPYEFEYSLLVEGQLITKGKVFGSKGSNLNDQKNLGKLELEELIDKLKQKQKKITNGILFKGGTLFDRQLEQAVYFRRLELLYDELEDIALAKKIKARQDGVELILPQELVDKMKEIEEIFRSAELKPNYLFQVRLANSALWQEIKDLFRTVEEHRLIRGTKKFYLSLSDEQRKVLKIDDQHGRSGELIQFIKKNKIPLILSGTGASAAIGSGAIWVIDLFTSDAEKRRQCAEKDSDDEFFNCFQKYMVESYKISRPFTYIKNGYEGLLDKLENDERRVGEFKLDYELFRKARTSFIVSEDEKKKFKQEFLEEIKRRVIEEKRLK